MQPEILDVLYRLVGEHGWNWGMARNLINRQFGTNYTIKELQRFYLRLTRFLNKCIVRNPRRRYSPHAGDFSPFTGFRLPFALHLTPSIVVTLNHSYTYRF